MSMRNLSLCSVFLFFFFIIIFGRAVLYTPQSAAAPNNFQKEEIKTFQMTATNDKINFEIRPRFV